VHSEKDEGLGTLKAGFVRIERRKSYSCEEEAIIALLPHSDFIVVSQGSNARTGRLGMVARQEGDDGGRGGGHHLRQIWQCCNHAWGIHGAYPAFWGE
jgi:hypothetical protein